MHHLKLDNSLQRLYLDGFEIKGLKSYQLNMDASSGELAILNLELCIDATSQSNKYIGCAITCSGNSGATATSSIGSIENVSKSVCDTGSSTSNLNRETYFTK